MLNLLRAGRTNGQARTKRRRSCDGVLPWSSTRAPILASHARKRKLQINLDLWRGLRAFRLWQRSWTNAQRALWKSFRVGPYGGAGRKWACNNQTTIKRVSGNTERWVDWSTALRSSWGASCCWDFKKRRVAEGPKIWTKGRSPKTRFSCSC